MDNLLSIEDLSVEFRSHNRTVHAVDRVSLNLEKKETLCLVGESGCGKTATGLSILGLIPAPPGIITSGKILFHGSDLRRLKQSELRKIRGRKIAMVFQEPMSALNPVFTIGNQIVETLLEHLPCSRKDAKMESIRLLESVGIPSAHLRIDSYPHELSGGMRQRAMIAMAISCQPELLIADEPTTALDVTIQAQIIDLLRDLREKQGMSLLLITHDLGVVAEMADRVAIMYAGQIVESGPVREVLRAARMPYTRNLLKCIPDPKSGGECVPIPGMVPDLSNLKPGCRFQDRCAQKFDRCSLSIPGLSMRSPNHFVRCFLESE